MNKKQHYSFHTESQGRERYIVDKSVYMRIVCLWQATHNIHKLFNIYRKNYIRVFDRQFQKDEEKKTTNRRANREK